MADTIALMKKRALEMAIRGELVERRPEEGTAEDTLKTIRLEKEYLIKTGEIKQSKSFSEVKESETPFQIPNSWKWVRLGEVVYNKGQKKPDKLFTYIDIASIDNKKQVLGQEENILRPENAPSRARKIVLRGDILYSTVRPYLHNMCIINREFSHEPIASTGFAVMRTPEGLENTYLFYYLLSPTFDMYANDTGNATGTAYPAINDNKLYNSVVPLPPLAEQKRIVAKIEEIFAVIDQIGTKKEEALSIIRNMRQTALQDAIMGVLVDQDENDEPASVLYEKIQAEKERMIQAGEIKRGKPLPEIEENEIPYEVPKNWGWTRLGDLGFYKKGPFGSALTKSIFVEDSLESIKVYEQKNAIQSDWTLGEYFITKKYYEEKMTSNTVIPGDIIISCAGTIGKSYIIPDNARLGIINQALMRVRVYTINKQYFRLIFNHVIQTDGAQGKGSAIKNIPPMKVLNNLLVPLPPLAEQDRIIEKIDTIMAICDQMEAILNGTTEANEALKISE